MDVKIPYNALTPFTEFIEIDQYESFINRLPLLVPLIPDISQLKNRKELTYAASVAASLFSDMILAIKEALSDRTKGIAVVDITESEKISPTENAFWGVVTTLALTKNIFQPAHDSINDTPFTIYAASHRNADRLASIGLPRIAPEEKLGFHTDGLLYGRRITLPQHIMLYNIAIEYDKPGNFHWIPFSLWEEKKKYTNLIGIGDSYTIAVTPSVYQTDTDELETVSPQYIHAPIFVNTASSDYPMYINGTVIGRSDRREFDLSIISEMKDSLSKNRIRFSIQQKTRRIIFARNVAGAHARDVFQLPNMGSAYTRVFMRSVDHNGLELE